jgi:Transposase DDE domain
MHPHEHLLRAARAQARTPQFKQAYPTRAVIERIIAWTATSHGWRIKLRHLGTSKNNAWLHNRSASMNLRTLINAGLTRQHEAGRSPDPQDQARPVPAPAQRGAVPE